MKQSSSSVSPVAFDLQGHRGCRGLMPENTIPAMIKAIDLGVTTIEMDVVISKDRQVVVSHEPFMSAEIASSPEGKIPTFADQRQFNLYEMNYDEIKRWDVGIRPLLRFPGQAKFNIHKPLLRDLIDSVEYHLKQKKVKPVQYSIEIKSVSSTDNSYHPEPAAFVELVMDVIKSKNIDSRIIIQSFDIRVLQSLHKNHSKTKTALLIEGKSKSPEQKLEELGFTPTVFSPEYRLVDSKMLALCKNLGMKLIPWTVNELKEIEKLKSMGVDGIITDYPDLIMNN